MSESGHLFDEGVGSARRPPGERLRQARERRGLTVAAVADTLRLSSAMIEALEQDRYEDLPPATFVRGYLRSYAELLGLSVDDVLQAHALAQPESDSVTYAGPVAQSLSGSHRARVVASVLGVAILALALVVVGWLSGERDAVEPDARLAEATRADTVMPSRPSAEPDLGQLVTPSVPVDEPGNEQAGVREPDDAATIADHEAVIQPEGREPVQVIPREEGPAETSEPAVDEPEVAETPDEVAAEPGEMTPVRVEFRIREGGQSWVEIEDAAGERVARRLFGSGERFSAEAGAPLSVFVGDAAEVELSIDGEPYDLFGHMRVNNTARLTIDPGAP